MGSVHFNYIGILEYTSFNKHKPTKHLAIMAKQPKVPSGDAAPCSSTDLLTKVETYMQKVDEAILKIPETGRLAASLGVRPLYLPLMLFLTSMTFFGMLEAFFVTLMATAYPAYASYKAMETPGEEDDKQWLTYWIGYACITSVEAMVFAFLACLGISAPAFYPVLKIGCLCWLSYFRGSLVVFHYLRPKMDNIAPHVDRFMSSFVTPRQGLQDSMTFAEGVRFSMISLESGKRRRIQRKRRKLIKSWIPFSFLSFILKRGVGMVCFKKGVLVKNNLLHSTK